MDIADIDGDGDRDIVTLADGSIIWYEHKSDVAEWFSTEPHYIVSATNRLVSLRPEDLDNDGDIDLVGAADDGKIVWYENRILGDADDDGEVAFADFLLLANNFGKEVDAVWAEGDFDGDGKVAFADFLILSENFGRTRP